MGGTGSGWQWGRKRQVGECAPLSAPLLQRRGILRPNVHLRGVIGWTRDGGIPFATIEYVVRTVEDEGDLLPTLVGESEPMPTIPLVTTPLPWGGLRWWFRCPAWRHGGFYRAAKLYLPGGADTFGCRRCWDLTYASCQASHRPSRLHKACERLLRNMGRQ